jgi:membrane protease YdiL (CAAX protease family)
VTQDRSINDPGGITAPWRLVVFVLACVVGVLGLRFLHVFVSPWIPIGARQPAFALVMAGGFLIGHVLTFRQVDPRGWSFVGLDRSTLDAGALSWGIALGGLAIAVPVGIMIGAGWARFEPGSDGSIAGTALSSLAFLLPAALWEELFVRGYAFSLLRERWGSTGALLATSAAFGSLHFLNDGATALSVGVVMLAGIFLGLLRLRTGSLYAAWMAHVAWNAVLVVGFHAMVSGVEMPAPGYRLVEAGPDLWTGGAWGPEGGLLAALGLCVAIWIIDRRPARRPEHEDA